MNTSFDLNLFATTCPNRYLNKLINREERQKSRLSPGTQGRPGPFLPHQPGRYFMADKPPEQSMMSRPPAGDGGSGQLTQTATARLSCTGMGMRPSEKKAVEAAAPSLSSSSPTLPSPPTSPSSFPSSEIGSQEIYSVATATDVGCPQCQDRFEISPEFFEALAECPKCQCEFVIKPPGTPSHQTAGPAKTDTSKLDRPAPSESNLKPSSASTTRAV